MSELLPTRLGSVDPSRRALAGVVRLAGEQALVGADVASALDRRSRSGWTSASRLIRASGTGGPDACSRPRGCVRSDRGGHDRVQQKGGVERRQNRALAFTQTRASESGPPGAHSGQGSTSRGPRAARSCVASRISSASLPACFTANAARSGRRQSECIRGGPHLAAPGSGSLRREPSPKLRPKTRVHDVSFQNSCQLRDTFSYVLPRMEAGRLITGRLWYAPATKCRGS